MPQQKVTLCKHICKECAFNGNTEDTLYSETFHILQTGMLFPCHMYLRAKTGVENQGTETLDTVRVCRGLVAYHKKFGLPKTLHPELKPYWDELLPQIREEELDSILSLKELLPKHVALRDLIYLGN